jgi:mannose-6-phosphate isomerase-like protein (cupin superfamily)
VRIEKNWGYEEIIHNGDYCCKLLVYTKPIASSLHYHEKKHETFVVASGFFAMDGGKGHPYQCCKPGDFIVLPPRHQHRIRCLEPGTIVEASTHDDPSDCVRLIPSES